MAVKQLKESTTQADYDERFEADAMDDADASLQAEAEEMGTTVEEMLIAQEEMALQRQDYQQSQMSR
jgi:hypothetical protein